MAFQTTTRKKDHKIHVERIEDIQKIGCFNPTYKTIDAERNVRTYGKKSQWDGHLKDLAKQMKDKAFWKQNKICDRVNRTLVRERTRFYTEST